MSVIFRCVVLVFASSHLRASVKDCDEVSLLILTGEAKQTTLINQIMRTCQGRRVLATAKRILDTCRIIVSASFAGLSARFSCRDILRGQASREKRAQASESGEGAREPGSGDSGAADWRTDERSDGGGVPIIGIMTGGEG